MTDAWLDGTSDDAQPFTVLREPQEVSLLIIDTQLPSDKAEAEGKRYIMVRMKIQNLEPGQFVPQIRHYLLFPRDGDDDDIVNQRKISAQEFYNAFSIEQSMRTPRNHEAWRNHMGKAMITMRTSEEYGEQNNIQRFML